ncbi:hypothetical protein BDV96DRAFT_598138 [Lophiotrema nucula]|uniref:Uncharacterized protein n=1 Tax=Lophiotrema nucula TaxID=690887 RepID=A0A6A5ZCJ7_9PLEO|nr:hypothetical protein BDV96DRAFT_598138 [Lophiotrema nucula]
MFDKFRTPMKRNATPPEEEVSETPVERSDFLDFMPKNGSAMMASSSGVTRRHRHSNMSLDLTPSQGTSAAQHDEGYATSNSSTSTPDSDAFGEGQDTPTNDSHASSPTSVLTPTSDTSNTPTASKWALLVWLTDVRTFASIALFLAMYFLPGLIFSDETLEPGLLKFYVRLVEMLLYGFGCIIGWAVKHVAWGFNDVFNA